MKFLISSISLIFLMAMSKEVVNFNKAYNPDQWKIVNDGVMGGLSSSEVSINQEGHLEFKGKVSLENNGGFASVQHEISIDEVKQYTHVKVKLKGDQKNYQLRLKSEMSQYQSYVHEFETSGEWEEITLKLSDFYPSFRGRKLDLSNFEFDQIKQITFLISNKKAEKFKLEVNCIDLVNL